MPWRRSSSRCSWVISIGSTPLQVAALPGPNQALQKQQDENQHDEQGGGGQAGEGRGKRQQEQDLNVENEEKNGVEIVVGLELDPGIAGRGDAAFVSGILHRIGLGRLKKVEPQPRHRQHHQRKSHRDGEEQRQKGVGMRDHVTGRKKYEIPRARLNRGSRLFLGRYCALIVRKALARSAPIGMAEGCKEDENKKEKPA